MLRSMQNTLRTLLSSRRRLLMLTTIALCVAHARVSAMIDVTLRKSKPKVWQSQCPLAWCCQVSTCACVCFAWCLLVGVCCMDGCSGWWILQSSSSTSTLAIMQRIGDPSFGNCACFSGGNGKCQQCTGNCGVSAHYHARKTIIEVAHNQPFCCQCTAL